MIKISSFKKLKNKIVCLFVALGMALSAFVGLSIGNNTKRVSAAGNNDIASTLFNDPTFTAYNNGSVPYTPSSWSRINGGNYNGETMVGGIFNAKNTNENYLTSYKVVTNPSLPIAESPDNNADEYWSLSLSAPYAGGGNFGYTQNSSNFNLSKKSFYRVDVTFKTVSGTFDGNILSNYGYKSNGSVDPTYGPAVLDSRASMYIYRADENTPLGKFEMVESDRGESLHNGWGFYSFYIATNEYSAESGLKLELWLGSKTETCLGTVHFGKIEAKEYSKNTFESLTENIENYEYKTLIDLRDNDPVINPISNPTFEKDWSSDWVTKERQFNKTVINNVDVTVKDSDIITEAGLTSNDLSGKNQRSKDNMVLLIANKEDSYTTLETKNDIEIKRQSYYKLSLWAWSNSGASSAPTLKLVNTTKDKTIEDATISVNTSSSSSNTSNGWVEYSFYIYGDANIDTTCKLQIVLGTKESPASGYLYVDDMYMKELSYTQYTNASSESNSTTFNYNNKSVSDYLVANYDFDITQNEKNSNIYPLKPASWTYTNGGNPIDEDTTVSGVINTSSDLFNKDDLKFKNGSSSAYNPGTLPSRGSDATTRNNVLMMGSRFENEQSYTSSSFSLSTADSYYKISFYVNALNGGASFKIANNNETLVELNNIQTTGWVKFNTVVKINAAEEGYTIKFSLVNNEADQIYAYFDEVIAQKVEESVYTSFIATNSTPSVYAGNFNIKLDHTKYDFEGQTNTSNGFTASTENKEGCYVKIMDVSELGVSAIGGNNALVVYSNNSENGVYYATTNRSFSLAENSYYKVSVFTKTLNVSGNGAFVKLYGTNLNKEFTSINKDGWTEYSFYIYAKAASTLQLDLGFKGENSCGYALFDNITFEKLTVDSEEKFNELFANLNNNDTALKTIIESSTDDSDSADDTTTEDDKFNASFDWYLVTALVTAVAILIAVIGVMLRKINWKHSKKVKNEYDRAKTLDKDLDRRERIAKRQQQIDVLESQLQEIEAEIEKIKAENLDAETKRKEENDRVKAEIEARREAIKQEKENALKERNEKIAKDKNAFTVKEEEDFNNYIKKLEKSEQKEKFELSKHDKKVNAYKDKSLERLEKAQARKEFILAEIARIDAEIEEIAREEAQIWEEYRLAKADAKKRKAEYKASLKQQKEKEKQERQNKKAAKDTENKPAKKDKQNSTEKSNDNKENK